MNGPALPPHLQAVYDVLECGEDVHVLNIYQKVIGKETNDQRFAQQVLGSYFTKLNRRLRGARKCVQPGPLKGTYRLGPIV